MEPAIDRNTVTLPRLDDDELWMDLLCPYNPTDNDLDVLDLLTEWELKEN